MSIAVLQGRPYHNFINSLKSKETKKEYRSALLRYLKHYKTTLEDALQLPVADTENMLIDYLMELKKKDLSHSSLNMNFCAIKHFYLMNDHRINKEKIGKFLGEPVKKNDNRGYTTTELKKILDNCDLRMKVVVSTMATTSMRIGALCGLSLADVVKMPKEGVYKFTIYKNTKEQSICYCSPACAEYIDQYFDYRRRAGDRLEPTGPFIREQFDPNDIEQVRKRAKRVTKDTISNMLNAIVTKAGLRKINRNYTGKERNLVPLNHGYRKWWMHEAVNAGMKPEIREMLLSHSLGGVISAYYKPDPQELLDEYIRMIDKGAFSLNEESKLRREVKMLTIEKSKVDLALSQIEDMKKQIGLA